VFQFLLGVLYFHESMPADRWAGFALVWLALSLLTADAWRAARKLSRVRQVSVAGAGVPSSDVVDA
jgi:chloramphenicol-sensitive protein RarD